MRGGRNGGENRRIKRRKLEMGEEREQGGKEERKERAREKKNRVGRRKRGKEEGKRGEGIKGVCERSTRKRGEETAEG